MITLHTPTHDFIFDVREMTTLDAMHVKRFQETQIAHPHEDPDAQILLVYFYSILINCSSGDVPSADEFLALPGKATNMWYEAVDEINPGLLPKADGVELTPEEVQADIEKKDLTQTLSMNG